MGALDRQGKFDGQTGSIVNIYETVLTLWGFAAAVVIVILSGSYARGYRDGLTAGRRGAWPIFLLVGSLVLIHWRLRKKPGRTHG